MLPPARTCLVPVVTIYHGFVGDGDTSIGSKDLTFLLLPRVDSKGEARVDAGKEVGHVVIQIRLADLGIGVEDVHD
jgi:hypothetical protein